MDIVAPTLAAFAALVAAYLAWLRVVETRHARSAAQLAVWTSAVQQSNDRNWRLFDHWDQLPPLREDWLGLDKAQIGFRTVLVNELNLLQWAWGICEAGIGSQREVDHWKKKVEMIVGASCRDEALRQVALKAIDFELDHYQPPMQLWLKEIATQYLRNRDS